MVQLATLTGRTGTHIDFVNLEVGENFPETVGIRIKRGKNIRMPVRLDLCHLRMRLSLMKLTMGLKDPIGKVVKFWDQEPTIVGIAEDFHFESLYQKVKPCFFQEYQVMPTVITKNEPGTEAKTLQAIRIKFEKF